MSELKERLDRLHNHIQQPDFIEGKGLSNEVNIRIFCYDPKDEMVVRAFIDQITTDQTLACHVIECNLFKLFLTLCEEIEILDSIPDLESDDGQEFLLQQLHTTFKAEDYVAKLNEIPHKRGDVLLITGVGDSFPFARVHTILNKLPEDYSDIPILVMYPGTFDGRHLTLFNRLATNDYYRAFNEI